MFIRNNLFLNKLCGQKACYQSRLLTEKKEIHTTEPFSCTCTSKKKKKLNKKDTHALVVRSGKFLRRLNRICGYTT